LWTLVPYLLIPDASVTPPYNLNNYRWFCLQTPACGSVTLPSGIGHTCTVYDDVLSCYNENPDTQTYVGLTFTETFSPYYVTNNYSNDNFDSEWSVTGQTVASGLFLYHNGTALPVSVWTTSNSVGPAHDLLYVSTLDDSGSVGVDLNGVDSIWTTSVVILDKDV